MDTNNLKVFLYLQLLYVDLCEAILLGLSMQNSVQSIMPRKLGISLSDLGRSKSDISSTVENGSRNANSSLRNSNHEIKILLAVPGEIPKRSASIITLGLRFILTRVSINCSSVVILFKLYFCCKIKEDYYQYALFTKKINDKNKTVI